MQMHPDDRERRLRLLAQRQAELADLITRTSVRIADAKGPPPSPALGVLRADLADYNAEHNTVRAEIDAITTRSYRP